MRRATGLSQRPGLVDFLKEGSFRQGKLNEQRSGGREYEVGQEIVRRLAHMGQCWRTLEGKLIGDPVHTC